ncbi:sugar transferase [Niabella ginsenosidivorans]|uniref:sugar transferase n=1 Tax=Niabella ginsenosidivorans TaxID=1176587 RepID=UPI001FE1C51C|nr:sugar transferase [Niabella ginsenosidivorans]
MAYIGKKYVTDVTLPLQERHGFLVDKFESVEEFHAFLKGSSILESPGVILLEEDDSMDVRSVLSELRTNPLTGGAIIIFLASKPRNTDFYRELKVNDSYNAPYDPGMIAERINFLLRLKIALSNNTRVTATAVPQYKMAFGKRLLDILVAASGLIILSPLMLIIALLVKLSGKGPVIYKSKRAGTGYKIFDFYKFRTMYADADQKLKNLSSTNNQYGNASDKAPQAFVKILNDPRITPIGAFLRKTSLDELPQLFNVLKGDMSLVGNRPLPLYEAEMLTSDQFAMRFLGPAGITGLWQISKRGKAEMSSEERIALDNHYAQYTSFWMDFKIVLKTIPAMLQKEKV